MPVLWRALVLLMIVMPVAAVEVPDLYTGVIPVVDQQEPTRQQAEMAAMQQVLTKVSGSSALLSHTLVQDNLKKASSFVQRYQFKLQSPASDAPADTPKQLVLEASFDQRAIDRLIQAAAAPIWGKRRPLTLMWLAVADSSGRKLIGDDNEPSVIRDIQDASRDLGVPVLLPLLDLEEAAAINISDVWGRFLDPMTEYSSRYAADATLVGRLEQQANQWQAEASLLHGQFRESFMASGANRAEAVRQLMAQIASFYADKYAVVIDLSKDAQQWVKVYGVSELRDYGKLTNFLQSLQSVQQVDVVKVEPNQITYSLRLIAEQAAFLQALTLDGRLQLVPESAFTTELEFHWTPR
ncbi:DUF2066 domain-containing protein [Permianibacter aggregans]|uniref:DUF2066 domain-containing protein n=1 Tax=Permianibacter aggregans TaxID=1510150 RepID=A0A4R6UV79_9GAMM|nr:DUF2066 domain-containing protein [Permianibacter aggregans]TDQ51288.1 hypothetical protein EV696_101262 [Permianibacter aggregans]